MIDSSTSKQKGKNFCKSLVVSHLFTYFAIVLHIRCVRKGIVTGKKTWIQLARWVNAAEVASGSSSQGERD